MVLGEILLSNLAFPIAGFLLKNYLKLGEPWDSVSGKLTELAEKKISNVYERSRADREFAQLSNSVIRQLEPLFEASGRDTGGIESVARELQAALGGKIDPKFFLERNLDPVQLVSALRKAHPLPANQFSSAEEALYDRALNEVVRYMVEVVGKLPSFQQDAVEEGLDRLSRIQNDLTTAIEGVKNIERVLGGGEKEARYEADYRQALIRKLDKMELFGVQMPEEASSHRLSVAYVSLNIRHYKERSDLEEEVELNDEPGERGGIKSIESALNSLTPENGRLLVRGAAGSGKSTLFRWTTITAARMDTPPEDQRVGGVHGSAQAKATLLQSNWRQRVPFLLRLRQCPEGSLPSPEDIPLLIAKEEGAPPAGWVKEVLDKGRAILLLDGVDEIPKAHRDQLREDIANLVERFPKNLFLISTRPSAVPENWLGSLGFRESTVEPMNAEDRRQFIYNWHQAVGKELKDRGRHDPDLPLMADKLIRELPGSAAASMSTTPLLCALICAMHWDNRGQLPANQVELFENTCHMLLHDRERKSIPPIPTEKFPPAYRYLEYKQKRLIVSAIAYYMVVNDEASVTSQDQARRIVAEELQSVRYPENVIDLPESLEERADQVIEWLIERCGVLRETTPGEIDFIHNSIKEFLAADRFVQERHVGQLVKNASDPTWQPVLLFAAGLGPKDFTDQLVTKLLAPKKSKAATRLQRFHAVLCAANVAQISPAVKTAIEQIPPRELAPLDQSDAELMTRAGNAVLRYLAYDPTLPDEQQAACVRALRLIGTSSSQDLLEGYLSTNSLAVISELCQAINPLRITGVMHYLEEEREGVSQWQYFDWFRHIDQFPEGISLKNIKWIYLMNPRMSNIDAIREASELAFLYISDIDIEDYSPLSYCSNLETVHLYNSKVNSLSFLEGKKKLKTLYLNSPEVKDFTIINSLKSLETLGLVSTAANDISFITGLKLKGLTLNLDHILSKDFSPLSQMVELRSLHILSLDFRDFTILEGLTEIEDLFLEIDGAIEDFSFLERMRSLNRLKLHGLHFSSLSGVEKLTKLTHLSIVGPNVKDVSALSHLRRLRTVQIQADGITDLSPLNNLRHLAHVMLIGKEKRISGDESMLDKIAWRTSATYLF